MERSAPEADVQTINRALIDMTQSVFSLTASRDRERSFESADWGGGHGIFTYYVVRGLEGEADDNRQRHRDGRRTWPTMSVPTCGSDRMAKQNPTSGRGSFDPHMLLAYVPANVEPDAPAPPKFGVLIIESNMDGVEVFVDGKSEGVVNRGQPLRLPGMAPGAHTVQGVKMG